MNIIITAEVTYEIYDVETFDDAVLVFQTAVTSTARYMEGVDYTGTKNLFATAMEEDGTFSQHPKIWEKEEV
jgi:hypothetical protein